MFKAYLGFVAGWGVQERWGQHASLAEHQPGRLEISGRIPEVPLVELQVKPLVPGSLHAQGTRGSTLSQPQYALNPVQCRLRAGKAFLLRSLAETGDKQCGRMSMYNSC